MRKKLVILTILIAASVVLHPEPLRAATPIGKQPGAIAAAAKRKAAREAFNRDPGRKELYKLRDVVRTSKDPQKRAAARKRIVELTVSRAAAAAAKLSPEEKAALADKTRRWDALRAALEPLLQELRAARTKTERDQTTALIRKTQEKYR